MDRAKIESIIRENGYDDFKWISGKDVVGIPVDEVQMHVRLLQLRQEGCLPAVGAFGRRMPGIFQRIRTYRRNPLSEKAQQA